MHSGQNHFCCSWAVSTMYSLFPTPPQQACVHWLQWSHAMPCWFLLTGLLHTVHGYLYIGPGLHSISPQASNNVIVTALDLYSFVDLSIFCQWMKIQPLLYIKQQMVAKPYFLTGFPSDHGHGRINVSVQSQPTPTNTWTTNTLWEVVSCFSLKYGEVVLCKVVFSLIWYDEKVGVGRGYRNISGSM